MIDNKEPPDWAMARAAELAGVGKIEVTANAFAQACSQMQVGFARYIAAHEEAPVDPLYEALFAVVELGRYDTREQTQLLRHELEKRGLTIVELAKTGGAA